MINAILRKWATYLSFFFTNKPLNTKKNEIIVKKIYSKIINYRPQRSNLKKTHIKFNLEVMELLKEKKIQNFLREGFIQKMFFVHNRLFIYDELKILKKSKKLKF